MPIIPLNRFDGGRAEDIRTTSTNQSENSYNFDIFTNPHKLIPIRDSVAETTGSGSMSDIQISDVVTSVVGSNVYLTAVGYESSVSTKPSFYTRSSGMNGSWTQQAVGTGEYIKGSAIVYNNKAYAISYNGSTQYSLQRYDSAGTVTSVGTITVTSPVGSGYPVPRPFIHPSDKKLYFGVSNIIAQYDGTTFLSTNSGISLRLPSYSDITSLTDYGDYLAISVRSRNGVGTSNTYLWDRSVTLVDASSVIDFGVGDLNIIENIGNQIIGIVFPQMFGGYNSVIDNKISIKIYAGGAVQTIKTFKLSGASNYGIAKYRYDDKLYFGLCESATEVSLWCVGKNQEGRWIATKERYIYNGSTTVSDTAQNVSSITSVGDYFYVATNINSQGFMLRATSTSNTYNNTSVYKTTINPSMPVSDRHRLKVLEGVQVSYTGTSGGTIGLKYSVDGSSMVSIISESTTESEESKEATNQADSIPFAEGREIKFQLESTGGVEIKELLYKYSVVNTSI